MKQASTHTSSEEAVPTAILHEDTGIIPFADEPERAAEPAEEQPRQDSASDAFGDVPKRESVADRELGINRFKWRREGKYACPCCGLATSRVMRVRVAQLQCWSAVCAVCAATLLARVPGTIVGGMVRPSRRRRKGMPGQVAHGFRRVDPVGYRRAG